MASYKTPDVYVEEISKLPPSVVEVSTAIPAFIGYTQVVPTVNGKTVIPVAVRVSTLLEFEALFGGPHPNTFTATCQADPVTRNLSEVSKIDRETPSFDFLLYYTVSMYFQNGGGSCYIVSIGTYGTPQKSDFVAGLTALEKEDEPTLILLTDAVNLDDTAYYDLCVQALTHCHKLLDRFAILDVLKKDDGSDGVAAFRNNTGTQYLSYGAAYHPYLQTSLVYPYEEENVKIASQDGSTFQKAFGEKGILVTCTGAANASPKVTIVVGTTPADVSFDITTDTLTINTDPDKTGTDVAAAWGTATNMHGKGFEVKANGDGSAALSAVSAAALDRATADLTMADIKTTNTGLYNKIRTAMNQQRITLPPSGAVAGVYASVDRDRGVWKAPANVSLAGVIGPASKITSEQQEALNVDPTAGKSINAIRAFTGKGTLIWGARTLDGNSNEWRYVPVRRLFIMIEESAKKATAFDVFEPNVSATWLKVKAMIESFLYGLWQQGALAGATPDAAYFVNVGLGKTMTPQDVLEGRMIVEIGVAAVRPAEFIILRFSHMLQQS